MCLSFTGIEIRLQGGDRIVEAVQDLWIWTFKSLLARLAFQYFIYNIQDLKDLL